MNPACKRQRLSVGTTDFSDDDIDEWGELDVDEDVMQQIETQGFSQHPIARTQRNPTKESGYIKNTPGSSTNVATVNFDSVNLQEELRTKAGEVKNLRLEMEHREKEYHTQVTEKNAEIAQLKKQLAGKKSEIEFQKLEMKSQISKNKLPVSNSPRIMNRQSTLNMNNTFHERFSSFSVSKNSPKEIKAFSFTKQLDKGDVLHKSLRSILSNEDLHFQPAVETNSKIGIGENNENCKLVENEFTLHIKSIYLQLCWYSSLEEIRARQYIKLIIMRTNNLLKSCHQQLSQEVIQDHKNRKSKIITLYRLKDTTGSINSEDLLKHTKLFLVEEGIAVRQSLAALCRLIQIQPKITEMLIEPERTRVAKCRYANGKKVMNTLEQASTSANVNNRVDFEEKMEIDNRVKESSKDGLVFDMVELLHDIVQEITIKHKLNEYEGVLCSILYSYSVICRHEEIIIYEKQQVLIVNTIQKILFSLPSFVIIRYILEFLSASTQYSFSESLCCRSAAETFSENFHCYNFTRETCMLQVLCAYIEMTKKTPDFIDRYTSWILSSLALPHTVSWFSNKTDSRLCECLLMLEQITIRIILNCIEQFNDSRISQSCKSCLKTSLNRCVSIFQHFRRRDCDFDLHIITCRGEYRLLLHFLNEILHDDRTRKFVNQEYTYADENQKYNLSSQTRDDIIKSSLKAFSQDYHFL